MTKRFSAAGLFVATLVAVSGCESGTSSSQEKVHELKGTVVSVDKERGRITIDHEDIPGVMKAMKMAFAVADPSLLERFRPGDVVAGKLKVEAGKYVITELRHRE